MTEMPALKRQHLLSKDFELRPIAVSDVDGKYQEWLNDAEVIRYLHVALTDRSPTALMRYVENVVSDPNRFFYIISERETAVEIGTISFALLPLHGVASYGFMIGDRDYWGTDAALQAQVILLDFAFHELPVRKMRASVDIANGPSQFNVKRLGFTKEGLFREECLTGPDGNEPSDVLQYGLLAREWLDFGAKFDKLRIHSDT